MKKLLPMFIVLLCVSAPAVAQTVLYEEHFTDGVASLDWFSGWNDSLGTPLTPMVPVNEPGPADDWIGVVTGDLGSLGSLGAAFAGDPGMMDYSMEAQVYVEVNSGFYNGIFVRADTTDGVKGYQFVANFNSMFGMQRLRFRYFSQFQADIRVLADFAAEDIPGGVPTEDGWHKMKIKAIGSKFWLYWDGQEMPGCPIEDPEAALDMGYFGVYVWDAMSGLAPMLKADDFIVKEESSAGMLEERFTDGVASLDWFSGWNDSLGTPLTPMVPTNEPGPTDDWIGVVTGDLGSLGSLGAAFAGDPGMMDYSMEAQVYVEVNSGFYNGIFVRADTTDGVKGYQLVANFNSMFGMQRLRFRYFSQFQADIRVLADFAASDIPGGAPTEDGWHKMKITAVGNKFWLYWDGQELPGCPIEDPEAALDMGYFGVYVWDGMSGVAPKLKVDDVVVQREIVTGIEISDNPAHLRPEEFSLHVNYPNPFNPETTISYEMYSEGFVDLTVYDMLGRRVKNLVSDMQQAGYYSVVWDGRDVNGISMPSGTYLYTLKTNGISMSQKMTLVK